MSSNFELKVS